MRTLAAVFVLCVVALSLSAPTLGAGLFWDFGNALGFAAFAGLLYLSIASARALHIQAHRLTGYAVLLITAAHVFWLLLGDAVVVEYLRPGAPHYMWAGIGAFVLLNIMTVIGLPQYRRRLHRDYDQFRNWHRWMAIAVIGGSAWHIIGAAHYLRAWLQILILSIFSIAAAFAYLAGRHNNDLGSRSLRSYLLASALFCIAFVSLRNLPL